jgi:hypothetical protein
MIPFANDNEEVEIADVSLRHVQLIISMKTWGICTNDEDCDYRRAGGLTHPHQL